MMQSVPSPGPRATCVAGAMRSFTVISRIAFLARPEFGLSNNVLNPIVASSGSTQCPRRKILGKPTGTTIPTKMKIPKSRRRRGVFNRLQRAFFLACDRGYFALRYDAAHGASAMEKLVGLFVYLWPMRKTALDFKAMYLRVRSGGRLLEIGCGSGSQLEFLHRLGWKTEGLDLDPVAVKIASARGLTVHAGSLKEQSFPDRYFDAVVSSHVSSMCTILSACCANVGASSGPVANSSSLHSTPRAGATCGFVVTGLLSTHPGTCIFLTQPHYAMLPKRQALPCTASPLPCATRTGYSGQVATSGTPVAMFGAAATLG